MGGSKHVRGGLKLASKLGSYLGNEIKQALGRGFKLSKEGETHLVNALQNELNRFHDSFKDAHHLHLWMLLTHLDDKVWMGPLQAAQFLAAAAVDMLATRGLMIFSWFSFNASLWIQRPNLKFRSGVVWPSKKFQKQNNTNFFPSARRAAVVYHAPIGSEARKRERSSLSKNNMHLTAAVPATESESAKTDGAKFKIPWT